MRTADAIDKDLAQADIELMELRDRIKGVGKSITKREAEDTLKRLSKRKSALQKERAELARPGAAVRGAFGGVTREALIKAAAEHRSIVIGTSQLGAVNQIRELFKEIAETDNILNFATYYYGPNAATNIPVLSPMEDVTPVDEPENSSDTKAVAVDDSTSLSVTEIQPRAYARVLPITAEMLQMGVVDIESQVPEIFRQSFQRVMHKGMLTGDGEEKRMKGIFTSAAANTAGQTAKTGSAGVSVTDLAGLALRVSSLDESFRLIMSPSTYQTILGDATDSEDIKIYKEGLIRDKSIEGVPILLDAYAPTESGKPVVVACPLRRYAIGVAGELVIKPIDVMGDTRTYYQAIMFFSAKQVSDTDLYSITG